ncbi:hypothetical protein HPB49_006152 [Dermacentor silvarum]|uniref:Uncharacterized protein n=1 Tax=Dermacentor silvarum TaxID=543639 RepID=A0ACB8DWG9_DERSI|nr:hypothetical protein HPB49_006152 [Dermacentor silvarum]
MEKVECRTVVEMRGDDMAHIVGDLVRERLIEPYVDAYLRAFDLSIEHRNQTNDTVTLETTQALKVHNARGVKGATITAEKDVLEKQKRTRMSPNDAIRKALGGDVFRKVMVCRSIPPLANQWRRPIIIPRHVFGDQYNGQDVMVPGPGTLQIKHSPTVGAAYNYHCELVNVVPRSTLRCPHCRRVELNPEQATEDELDESDARERPWNTASCSGRALTVPKFMSRQILGVVYGRI